MCIRDRSYNAHSIGLGTQVNIALANLLKAALQSAIAAEAPLTDDCSAVERLGKEVHLTEGSEENIKITTPVDLAIAEAILQRRGE